ncbi:MAG: hypothetical protein WBA73_02880 [Devosia sp.]
MQTKQRRRLRGSAPPVQRGLKPGQKVELKDGQERLPGAAKSTPKVAGASDAAPEPVAKTSVDDAKHAAKAAMKGDDKAGDPKAGKTDERLAALPIR